MKEKFTIAAIVIALTFLIGYLTVQTTIFIRDMIFGEKSPSNISLEMDQ